MNIEDIQRRLDEIRAMVGDDEAAHAEQDKLYRDVLAEIAKLTGRSPSARWAAEMAAEALKVDEIEFSRWYA